MFFLSPCTNHPVQPIDLTRKLKCVYAKGNVQNKREQQTYFFFVGAAAAADGAAAGAVDDAPGA